MGRPLLYYADIPYALWYPEQLAEITEDVEAEIYSVSEEGLRVWQEAASAYATQLTVLFGGEEMMKKALKLNWRAKQYIQLFR
jgi:LmbE family N-acetylglucosaminyl deacetylase